MEVVLVNPGFQHIAESVFWFLNLKDLLSCSRVCMSFRTILNNPQVWLNKCIQNGLLKEHCGTWKEAIHQTKENKYQNFQISLRGNLVNILRRHCKDIPCFINSKSMKILLEHQARYNFRNNTIFEHNAIIQLMADQNERSVNNPGVVQLIAPLTNNPNAQDLDGITPMQRAAIYGYHNIVKALIPFIDIPNSPDPAGWTPLQNAVMNGYVEVIKALAPLTEEPNAPDPEGWTPIQTATLKGYTEVVKVLAPLSQDPNWSNTEFPTPMSIANVRGHEEIISILKPFI